MSPVPEKIVELNKKRRPVGRRFCFLQTNASGVGTICRPVVFDMQTNRGINRRFFQCDEGAHWRKRLEKGNRKYFLLTNGGSGVTIRPYSKQPKAMMERSSPGAHPQRAGDGGNPAAEPGGITLRSLDPKARASRGDGNGPLPPSGLLELK